MNPTQEQIEEIRSNNLLDLTPDEMRIKLKYDVEEFLANGGAIQQIEAVDFSKTEEEEDTVKKWV